MGEANGLHPVMGVEDTKETLSPMEVVKPFPTIPRCEDTPPNLSSHASSVTLAVNDQETETNVEGANEKETAKGPVSIDADKVKKSFGWPSRRPFHTPLRLLVGRNGVPIKEKEDLVYWADLTLKQKMAWRKAFLSEYLAETKKCLPFVWKLYVIIYRLSPWRAIVLFVVSIFRGFLPALTLQTRGNFIMLVNNFNDVTNGSCKKALRKRHLTSEDC